MVTQWEPVASRRPVTSGWGGSAWLVGLLLGAGWGLAARGWMAFLTEHPQVTVSGTAFVVAGAALVGAALRLVEDRRRAGGRPWWRGLALLPLFYCAGPGIFFLPALVFGGYAFSGRGPRIARVAAVAPPLLMVLVLNAEEPGGLASLPRAPAVAVAWFVLLMAWGAYGTSVLARRWPPRRRMPIAPIERLTRRASGRTTTMAPFPADVTGPT